ncbi:hypothetical protein F5146DRAFT_1139368 [Armillaria mellea]|nr:hypothetical protein F5146DRAFT_1139368 [Armillaria mellea]
MSFDLMTQTMYSHRSRTTAWYVIGNVLMEVVISFYVQSFFCYRLYALSKMWWIVAPVMTYYIASLELGRLAHWISVHDATAFGTAHIRDPEKQKTRIAANRQSPPNALVRLTFQTAALPVIWYVQLPRIPAHPQFLNIAMINLNFVYTGDHYSTNIITIFIQALPKLYAISMMWTLNARRPFGSPSQAEGAIALGRLYVARIVERSRRVYHWMFEPPMINFQLFCAQDEISLSDLNRHIKPAAVFAHPDSDTEMG